jgi:hypothetical protein
MTCIGEGAREGDWCRVPPLVWVELAPPVFWHDHAAVVHVLLVFDGFLYSKLNE